MKDLIKEKAAKLAMNNGIHTVTRDSVCKAAGIPPGSFKYYMGVSFGEFLLNLRKELPATNKLNPQVRVAQAEIRREFLLKAGVKAAQEIGFNNLTRKIVAQHASVSPSLFQYYFKTIENFKNSLMRYAVENQILEIIAYGIATGHSEVSTLPKHLKLKAISSL